MVAVVTGAVDDVVVVVVVVSTPSIDAAKRSQASVESPVVVVKRIRNRTWLPSTVAIVR